MNATDSGEIRVAILENGDLAEIFIERKSHVQQTGNIYKGKVVNVEPSLQAAFVDLGLERNGFLHASDCIPPDGGYTELLKAGPKAAAATQAVAEIPAEAAAVPADLEAAAVSAAAETTAPEAAPAEAGHAAEGTGNGGSRKRRRRRRGGRGRSGRGRAPSGSSPMMAPRPDGANGETGDHAGETSATGAQPTEATHAAEANAFAAAGEGPAAQDEAAETNDGGHEAEGVASGAEVPDTRAEAAEPAGSEEHEAPATETSAPVTLGATAGGDDDGDGDEFGEDVGEEDVPDAEASEEVAPAAPFVNEDTPVSAAEAAVAGEDSGALAVAESVQTAEGEAQAKPAAPNGSPGAQQRRDEHRGRDRGGRGNGYERRHTVQEMLKRGHEVLVQVAKEGMGQKGPALTTYLSLPGRYLVLMPAVQRLGVSKRIDSEEQRRALKDILAHLKTPEGMGVIVRTAGMGRSQEELQRDLDFLMQKWEALKKKAQIARAPALLFQEGDVITRVFRDILADDVTEIIVDDPVVMERAKEFLREMSPGSESKIKLYAGNEPIFHKYGVERQLSLLFNRKVALKGGGSIVIEQTEAMVAIDVNTGRYREKHTQDETILATNLEAAREVARQLRLRDIGGLVMIDFIDMDHMEHRRRVEREFKAHLARDKARINVMPISPLGIVEMTRQRVRHGIRRALFERCSHCHGVGQVKSPESIGLEVLREIRAQLVDQGVSRVRVTLHSAAACAILNRFRRDFIKLEDARGVSIEVASDDRVQPSQFQIATAKAGGDFVVKKVSEVDDYVRNS